MKLRQFILRRAALAVPLLMLVVFFTFMLVRLGGQDPVALLAGPSATAEEIQNIRSELKLDQSLWSQLVSYVWRLAHFDLGHSWTTGRPVLGELLERMPPTLELLFFGLVVGTLIGIPLGIRSAAKPGGWLDQFGRSFALLGFSIPSYWLGLVMLFVFFYLLGWAPPGMGRISLMEDAPAHITGSYFIDALLAGNWSAAQSAGSHLILPVLCVGIVAGAPIARQARAIAASVYAAEHIRFARASGLPERTVRKVALRNSLTPIITFLGIEIVSLIGTTALIEYVFAWGGLGYFGLDAMMRGDFAVVQGYALLTAFFSVAVFLVVDALILILEPRAMSRE